MLAAELDNFARLRRILEEQVASLRAERTTLTGDLDALRDLTAQLQSDLTTTQQAFSELTDGASVLEAANSAIEQQLSEAFDRLTEVEKERDLAIVLAEEIQLLRDRTASPSSMRKPELKRLKVDWLKFVEHGYHHAEKPI